METQKISSSVPLLPFSPQEKGLGDEGRRRGDEGRPGTHFRATLVVVLVLAKLLSVACQTTPDTIMARTRDFGGVGEEAAIKELVGIVARRGDDPGIRAYALRALSEAPRLPPFAVAEVGTRLRDNGDYVAVRAWAAVALGRSPSPAALAHLVAALAEERDPTVAYYTLEALAHHAALIVEDAEVGARLVEAEHALAAHLADELPDMFDLVAQTTTTLAVLVAALERADAAPPSTRAADAADAGERAYAALYRALDHVLDAKRAYVAAFAEQGPRIARLCDAGFRLRSRFDGVSDGAGVGDSTRASAGDRGLSLLLGWYVGLLADEPDVAEACHRGLSAWIAEGNAAVGAAGSPGADDGRAAATRAIVAWAASRMTAHLASARRDLLARLRVERDEYAMRLLARLSRAAPGPDLVQKALDLPVGGP